LTGAAGLCAPDQLLERMVELSLRMESISDRRNH
jgi:hypothetical protein